MQMITEHPIVPGAMHALIGQKFSGSVVFHYAVVKQQHNKDKAMLAVEYRLVGDAISELRGIKAALRKDWHLEDVLLVRRVGTLQVGDVISLIAVSSPSSKDAFASCKSGISRMKKMATIKKNEMYG